MGEGEKERCVYSKIVMMNKRETFIVFCVNLLHVVDCSTDAFITGIRKQTKRKREQGFLQISHRFQAQ